MDENAKSNNKLIAFIKSQKLNFFIMCVSGILYNVVRVYVMIYQGKMIDSLLNGDSYSVLLKLIFMFFSINLFVQTARFLKRLSNRSLAKNLAQNMREIIYNNIIFMNMNEFSSKKIGELMSVAISDVDTVVNGFRKITNEIFDTGILLIATVITMLSYDVKLTIISVIFVPLSMICAYYLKKITLKYTQIYRKQSSKVSGLTFQIVENFLQFKIYSIEDINEKIYEENLEDLRKKAANKTIAKNGLAPIYSIIACIGTIPIIYFGGIKVINGDFSVGDFSAYFAIALSLFLKTAKASVLFSIYAQSKVSYDRILPYLKPKQHISKEECLLNDFTELSVENLSFSYGEKNANNIIENLSFTAKSGQIIGVAGKIASGKSSLIKAFMNLYPYDGSIKVDGTELSSYTKLQSSKIFGFLLHDPQLFSASIEENISFDDKVNVNEVLDDVCFTHDIQNMPDKLETVVGNNGVRLSGGQMARISTARALAKRNGISKKIFMLDDPFSALDMKTEEKIIENLRQKYKDSIIIIVSHRLSIFDKIDKVIFFDENNVTVSTHDKLLESSEFYKNMYSLQMVGE